MKQVNNYICLVDYHRRPSRCRNTAGRYRVGAKTPKEAIKLLREKIGFGSIQCYYQCDISKENPKRIIGYKEVVKEVTYTDENGKMCFKYVEPHHATAPIIKSDF